MTASTEPQLGGAGTSWRGAMAAVHWFRKGLRLHDNPALLAAAAGSKQLLPVFVLDPHFLKPERCGANRVKFLLECLADLDGSLRRLGSRLLVLRGSPEEVLLEFMAERGAALLTFETHEEPHARARDAAVRGAAEKRRIRVEQHCSDTLWEPAQLLAKNGGQPPKTYTTMLKMAAAAGPPPAPLAPPASLPSVGAALLADSRFDVPTLAQLGYDPAEAQAVIAGGETEGLRRLDAFLADAKRAATFEKPKTNPTHLQPSTTALSPHLTAGAVSARTFYHRVAAVVRQYKGSKSSPPVSLEGQILWREHWLLIASNTPGKTQNTPFLEKDSISIGK